MTDTDTPSGDATVCRCGHSPGTHAEASPSYATLNHLRSALGDLTGALQAERGE